MSTFVTNKHVITLGLNGSPMVWLFIHEKTHILKQHLQLSPTYSDWAFVSVITEHFILSLIDYGFPDSFTEKLMQEMGTMFCFSPALADGECIPFIREKYLDNSKFKL